MPLDQPENADDPVHAFRMPLGEHLEELRTRLIHALLGIAAALLITAYFGFQIIAWLAAPMLQVRQALGYPPQTITTDPSAGFMSVYLKVTVIAAVILASPWVIYQIWKFIVTGLYAHEKRAVYLLTPFSTIMTILGVLFTYYILLPVCLFFFLNFATFYPKIDMQHRSFMVDLLAKNVEKYQPPPPPPEAGADADAGAGVEVAAPLRIPILTADPDPLEEGMLWMTPDLRVIKLYHAGEIRQIPMLNNRILDPWTDVTQYVSFAAMMGLGIVIAFQIPVVMLILGRTGLIDPQSVAKVRKYAFFACAAVAAILTPVDIFSMLLLWLPLYALFEFGLLMMRLADPYKHTLPDQT